MKANADVNHYDAAGRQGGKPDSKRFFWGGGENLGREGVQLGDMEWGVWPVCGCLGPCVGVWVGSSRIGLAWLGELSRIHM